MMTNHHEERTQRIQRSRSRLVFLKWISACAAVVAFTLFAMVVVAAQQQELPRFRSSVELTPMDVGVFDDRGQPVADLKPEDFTVRVDGNPRRVVNATWIPLEAPPGPSVKPPPDGYTANNNATSGRLILLVVDQPNIRFGGTRTIRRAANAFIDRLQPADRAAVVGIGPGSPSVGFTSDRARVKKAIEAMVGQHRDNGFRQHNIALTEALDVKRGMPGVLDTVIERECVGMNSNQFSDADRQMCMLEVQHELDDLATSTAVDGQDTITALRRLLTALRGIDAPKTLVLLSEGFLMQDQIQEVTDLGMLAASARTSIYALRLDDQSFMTDAAERFAPIATMSDRSARGQGMETLVAASRGALFNVIGTGETIFEHITAELSGYYLLGVESGPTDKDGKAHPIRVDVNRKGLTVRSRRALINATEIRKPRNARESIMSALETPLPLSALPLRVATYSLQGPEADKVQILIHADVGSDYSASRVVSLGYLITDETGRLVDSQMANARLQPVMNGVPSALQYAGGASLPPGEYTLKLAVAEGDRVGTVEHTVHAGVQPASSLRVSDLMVGGPTGVGRSAPATIRRIRRGVRLAARVRRSVWKRRQRRDGEVRNRCRRCRGAAARGRCHTADGGGDSRHLHPHHAHSSAAAWLVPIARQVGVCRADGQSCNTSLRSGGACRPDDVRIVKHALHTDRRVLARFRKHALARVQYR